MKRKWTMGQWVSLLALGAVLIWGGHRGLSAQSLAITFDDGPKLEEPPLLTPKERNQALLKALKRHRVRAALFVTWNRGADRPEGLTLLKEWGEAGHLLGNHTLTHIDLNKETTTLEAYQGEIVECDAFLRGVPGYRPWFRYTYLRQGNTAEKIKGMRTFLKERGLRNAYVTLDTSDWRLDHLLVQTLKKNPQADLTPFRTVYLEHLRQRAEAYRAIAQRLFGRDIPQILLLHHNLLNALFLDDLIGLFKSLNWTIADPEVAYQDFVYSLDPQSSVSGQSLLIAASRSLGYRPDNWLRLLDDGDADVERLRGLGVEVGE